MLKKMLIVVAVKERYGCDSRVKFSRKSKALTVWVHGFVNRIPQISKPFHISDDNKPHIISSKINEVIRRSQKKYVRVHGKSTFSSFRRF